MLECTNCGAVGESFFSPNYFGEMVCELCGTQSFLQARNETQDAEDMVLDVARVSATLKRTRKRRTKPKSEPNHKKQLTERQRPGDVELSDCLIATQMILDYQARALVERVGPETVPLEYVRVVKELWFKLLETWGTKGEIPLLRCFTEFFMPVRSDEQQLDLAITTDLLEQWDAEREREREEQEQQQQQQREREQDGEMKEEENEDGESLKSESVRSEGEKRKKTKRRKLASRKRLAHCGKLDRFSILDLLGLLMLASRVLNLGLLPSDFANWVASGVLPFHNLVATCCADAPDVREAVSGVAMFFDSVFVRHNVSSARVAYHAHFLQYHMDLRLPPLNVPLAAHRLCGLLGLPGEVFRNFQWITGFFNVEGDQPELPILLLEDGLNPKTGLPTPLRTRSYVEQLLATESGIVAHLVVAIRMCAGWEEWVLERQHRTDAHENAPPSTAVFNPRYLLRRDLDAYLKVCEQAFVDPERSGVPAGLQDHVDKLKRLQTTNEMLAPENDPRREDVESFKQHYVCAYPAIHIDGALAENDGDIEQHVEYLRSQEMNDDTFTHNRDGEKEPTYFYPRYSFKNMRRSAMHAPFENLLELLCQQIGAPIATIFVSMKDIDRRIERLCKKFAHTGRTIQALVRYTPLSSLAIDAPKCKAEPATLPDHEEHEETED